MANSAALNSISSEPSENVEEGGEERITSSQTHGPPDEEKPDQSQVRVLKSYLRRAENRSHIQNWRLHVQYIWVTVFFLNINIVSLIFTNNFNKQFIFILYMSC